MSKRRIAILGSGQAALTAATQMTDPRNPAAKDLELTVYQLGWRLGGKGAAGRNVDPAGKYRIEEHGLHNWFGFYDNSFRQIRDVYGELSRPPDAPLASWKEAFIPEWEAVFVERVKGRQTFWKIENPTNAEEPGSGGLLLPLWEYVLMGLEMISGHHLALTGVSLRGIELSAPTRDLVERVRKLGVSVGVPSDPAHGILKLAHALARQSLKHVDNPHAAEHEAHAEGSIFSRAVHALTDEVEKVVEDLVGAVVGPVVQLVLELLRAYMWTMWEVLKDELDDDDVRRFWIMANFVYAIVVGCIRDGVLTHGFTVINDVNFRDWVAKHAYPDGGLTVDSVIMRAVYDSSFAYVDGDSRDGPGGAFPPKAQYEAGTALQGMVRAALTYKGAFGYKFAASTADTCYAPMYEVLKKRGVKFRFFHRVLGLKPGASASDPIGEIELYRQVDLAGDRDEYEPLFDVKGLPCWPSQPLWDQLEDGAALRQSGVDFEHPQRELDPSRKITLKLGEDFDDVVLGISVAALPNLCGGLFELSERWRRMRDHVRTTRTMALQLWSKKTASEMGWPNMGRPMTSFSYDEANYLNVWGDLTDLVPMEGWTSTPIAWDRGGPRTIDEAWPQNVAYFTTAMLDDPKVSPHELHQDWAKCHAEVRAVAVKMCDQALTRIWPATNVGTEVEPRFDWSVLVDAREHAPSGLLRIDSQYIRANVSPTERYVLSVPGSTKHRLQAHDDAEFPNLYLAGDWTWCGINAGCMEAATMSGMLCSLAATGYPKRDAIIGVDF